MPVDAWLCRPVRRNLRLRSSCIERPTTVRPQISAEYWEEECWKPGSSPRCATWPKRNGKEIGYARLCLFIKWTFDRLIDWVELIHRSSFSCSHIFIHLFSDFDISTGAHRRRDTITRGRTHRDAKSLRWSGVKTFEMIAFSKRPPKNPVWQQWEKPTNLRSKHSNPLTFIIVCKYEVQWVLVSA